MRTISDHPALRGLPAAQFEATPHAAAAVRVRRWDDQAKDPHTAAPGFSHFRELLCGLVS
jgi:predicted HD phosphohydrolase